MGFERFVGGVSIECSGFREVQVSGLVVFVMFRGWCVLGSV